MIDIYRILKQRHAVADIQVLASCIQCNMLWRESWRNVINNGDVAQAHVPHIVLVFQNIRFFSLLQAMPGFGKFSSAY